MIWHIYKLLIKYSEWISGEKIQPIPDIVYVESETGSTLPTPLPKLEIPFDYKILIIAPTIQDAADYANALMLEPHHWAHVDSIQDIHYYNQQKCEVHLTGNWFKSQKIHDLVSWAAKESYTIV